MTGGTQFGKLIVAYKKWGSKEAVERDGISELMSIYVKFHEEAEKDPSLNDEARAWFTKMEHGDEEALSIWRWFLDISLKEFMRVYDILGMDFDSYNGESFYNDKMPAVIEELKEKNLITVSDGAQIVDLEKYNMRLVLSQKKDGSSLYATRDIAAAIYRQNTYHFTKCLYVTVWSRSFTLPSGLKLSNLWVMTGIKDWSIFLMVLSALRAASFPHVREMFCMLKIF